MSRIYGMKIFRFVKNCILQNVRLYRTKYFILFVLLSCRVTSRKHDIEKKNTHSNFPYRNKKDDSTQCYKTETC